MNERRGPSTRIGARRGRRARQAVFVACALLAATQPARAQQLPQQPKPDSPLAAAGWRSLTEADLTYLASLIKRDYIYAVYPGGADFDAQLERSLADARKETALVKDYGGYRAVLQHFIVSFGDAHFSAYFAFPSPSARWPGFTIRYRAGAYVVDKSTTPEVRPGETVESCDGRDLSHWTDELAKYFGGPAGRETTRAAVAQQFLVDRGNPLYKAPQTCRVAGRDVTLAWRPASSAEVGQEPLRTSSSATTIDDGALSVSDLGAHGAWVRIGTMLAWSPETAAAYQALVDKAPSLRDKDVIVIDVRGNAGGAYNWFMAFLRGLYGQPYADYYARARLEISDVSLLPAGEKPDPMGGAPAEARSLPMPPDPPYDSQKAKPVKTMLPGGGQLSIAPAPIKGLKFPAKPPADPVRARVYLLTDYGCGSACISFVDEMMRFPGVTLVGAETHVDRRSGGYPVGFELPSGLAVVRMGRMVREGRARGENEAWVPAPQYRFQGDIRDTEAVKRWILETVVPADKASRAPWRQTATLKGPE